MRLACIFLIFAKILLEIAMKYSWLVPISSLMILAAGCGVVSRNVSTSENVSYTVTGNSPQHKYIAKYADMAVRERVRAGVPASITLAQGMLESGNGQSELAVKANNHFGIKCHDWKGAKTYYNDDRRGECFRKYKDVEDSFRDHSDFLRYRDRYKFLFEFDVTDYKSWAYGLKKAGYATDPAYPQKLIRLIEEYDLDQFDKKTSSIHRQVKQSEETPLETPLQLETPKPLSREKGGSLYSLSLSRQLYSQNGVPFVYSAEGETYAGLAKSYDLFFKEILRYNDLDKDKELLPGTVVYLQPKKSKASRHVDKYITEGGENLRDISQRFAVKMKNLMKYNGLDGNETLTEGQTIFLRNSGK